MLISTQRTMSVFFMGTKGRLMSITLATQRALKTSSLTVGSHMTIQMNRAAESFPTQRTIERETILMFNLDVSHNTALGHIAFGAYRTHISLQGDVIQILAGNHRIKHMLVTGTWQGFRCKIMRHILSITMLLFNIWPISICWKVSQIICKKGETVNAEVGMCITFTMFNVCILFHFHKSMGKSLMIT